MQRLLYTSQARLNVDPGMEELTVRQLAAVSATRNRKAGLTGALIYIDNTFIQVIEGFQEDVETVFERICCDFRHCDVRLIDLVPVKERMFASWGMACLSESVDTTIPLREGLEEIRFMVGVNAREAVEQMRRLLGECDRSYAAAS